MYQQPPSPQEAIGTGRLTPSSPRLPQQALFRDFFFRLFVFSFFVLRSSQPRWETAIQQRTIAVMDRWINTCYSDFLADPSLKTVSWNHHTHTLSLSCSSWMNRQLNVWHRFREFKSSPFPCNALITFATAPLLSTHWLIRCDQPPWTVEKCCFYLQYFQITAYFLISSLVGGSPPETGTWNVACWKYVNRRP